MRSRAVAALLAAFLASALAAAQGDDLWGAEPGPASSPAPAGGAAPAPPAECSTTSDGRCPASCDRMSDPDCWSIRDKLAQLWEGACNDINGDVSKELTEADCRRAGKTWDGTTGKVFYLCILTFFGSIVGMVIYVIISINERAEKRKAEEQKLGQFRQQQGVQAASEEGGGEYPEGPEGGGGDSQQGGWSAPQPPQAPSGEGEQQGGWSDSGGNW